MDQTADHHGPSERADKPAPSAQTIPKDNAPDPDQRGQAHDRKQDDRLDTAMVRWTRVVGVFTAVLAVFGAIQTCAFIQSERAFVAVSALRISGGLTTTKPLVVTFELKNAGRSQGFVTAFNSTVSFMPKNQPLPAIPEYKPGKELAPGTVLSGLTATVNAAVNGADGDGFTLTSESISLINSGNYQMYVFGYVRYRDEFSDLFLLSDKINGFCQLLAPSSDPKNAMFINCAERAYTYSH